MSRDFHGSHPYRDHIAKLARQRAGFFGTQGGYAIAGGVAKTGSILGGWASTQGAGASRGPSAYGLNPA